MFLTSYETHAAVGAATEAHRKYIDVMYMVEGEEIIYVKPVEELRCITKPYDPSMEALLAETDPDAAAIRLTPGRFVVLFPQDAHAPACHADGLRCVKKIIGKIRVN